MEEITKKDLFKLFTIRLFVVFLILIVCFIIVYKITKRTSKATSPVERCEIDSLTNDNNIIKYDIKHIDSIKYEKIEEVKNLNNDSTINLFYKLISK